MNQSLDDIYSRVGIDTYTMEVDVAMQLMAGNCCLTGQIAGFNLLEQDDYDDDHDDGR